MWQFVFECSLNSVSVSVSVSVVVALRENDCIRVIIVL
jgi:hypothetical protein